MAVISNIFIDAGTDFSTTVTVTDSTGSAVNLSGYSHAAQIRKSYDSSSATASFTLQRPLMHQQVNLHLHYQTHKRQPYLMVDMYMMQL